jgi:hypothetical protein
MQKQRPARLNATLKATTLQDGTATKNAQKGASYLAHMARLTCVADAGALCGAAETTPHIGQPLLLIGAVILGCLVLFRQDALDAVVHFAHLILSHDAFLEKLVNILLVRIGVFLDHLQAISA